jgi:hypothetical protein
MVNAQRVASSLRAALRSMARRARVAAYSHAKRSGINRDWATRDGVRVLVHIEDVEQPLHQGYDPPVMKIREDAPRGQPVVRQGL